MTAAVTVLGSANLDRVHPVARVPAAGETVLATGPSTEHPGGKGLNQAVAAARAGARVRFVGTVGDDEPGRRLAAVLHAEGVDTTALETVHGTATGVAHITVQADGDNAIVVVPGANGVRHRLTGHGRRAVAGAPVLLAQLEVPTDLVADAAGCAAAAGAVVVLNAAPALEEARELLGLVDVLVVNEHEAVVLAGADGVPAAARTLVSAGRDVVVTLGPRGALLLTRTGHEVRVPATEVVAVDTTGAGDAMAGTLAAALAAGQGLPDAVRRGCAAGALAVQVAGAVPSMPTRQAVDALLSDASRS